MNHNNLFFSKWNQLRCKVSDLLTYNKKNNKVQHQNAESKSITTDTPIEKEWRPGEERLSG